MYGYVVVNKPELKFREFDEYRSYYCGLCTALKESYGAGGQFTISYDMTFLVLLLTGLYEPEVTFEKKRCKVHPIRLQNIRRSVVTDYVADMNLLLAYYKCMDDWNDEKKILQFTYAQVLQKKARKVEKKYPDKARLIMQELALLSQAEQRKEQNIDVVSAHFANILSCIATMKEDEWAEELRHVGYFLGKFVYLCDAYEDIEKDEKKGNYNVFAYHKQEDFDTFCESILNAAMAECARSFERLPILQEADILRNIIYAGVWTRFQAVKAKRQNKAEQ